MATPFDSESSPPAKYGYKLTLFAGKVQMKYLCSYCKLILRDPVQSFCGHRFCKSCIDEIARKGGGQQCEACVEEGVVMEYSLISMEQTFPDKALKRELAVQAVTCPNKPEGCEWDGTFKDYEEVHEAQCEFERVTCPQCSERVLRKNLQEHEKTQCNKRKLTCQFCQQEIPAADMAAHQEKCADSPVSCPECGKKKILQSALAAHRKNDCKVVKVPCQVCKNKIDKNQMREHMLDNHLGTLIEKIDSLESSFRESNWQKHSDKVNRLMSRIESIDVTQADKETRIKNALAALEERAFSKKGSKGGAEFKKLTDYQPRLNNVELRVDTYESIMSVLHQEVERISERFGTIEMDHIRFKEVLESMERKNKALERVVALKDVALAEQELRLQSLEMTSYDGVILWKIKDFAKRRHEAIKGQTTSIYSPAFYTSRTGYKMCCRVYLNGDGMGKGSHISAFFVIMRGQYDALQKWPFRQKVTIMLMDQNNREHCIDAFRPDATSSSFKRPTSDMNIASGCPLFMPLSQLESSRHAYLKDDTIFIKCIVDISDL